MASTIDISVFRESDWEIYRALRLQSLEESPDAFGSTYAREVAFSDDQWKSRLAASVAVPHLLPLAATSNGLAVGLASGVVHDSNPMEAHVYQMWVAPRSRGLGAGRELLAAIIRWADELQLTAIRLAVTTTNTAAISLYRSAGFQPAGDLEPLREGSLLQVQPMRLTFSGRH